jgi:hypothetical protein
MDNEIRIIGFHHNTIQPPYNEFELKSCSEGKERNPLTNRCVKKCKEDYIRNSNFKCVKQKTYNIEFRNLAHRDLVLEQIEKQIKAKKQLLVNKSKDLKKKQDTNEFLDIVKNDYNKYYTYILKEKQQQYEAMNMLNNYLDDLIKSEKLVNNQLRTAKIEQGEILSEMNKIKTELDELVSS